MERRRGDSYLGKELSEPPGSLPEDAHVSKKIECVDCHQTGRGGMGHIERKAGCQDCHLEVEQAMTVGLHKNVACEACHVKVLGGYEMTSWGPGMIESQPNPFKKYSLYYGPQGPPILVKDQSGRWMPTKIWPNSMGGFKDTVAPIPGLTFRWPKGETKDAYAQLGTFSVLNGNNNYLAWIQVEQVAHPLGKSRSCKSCHGSSTQRARVTWRYFDTQGADPFMGSQKVTADKDGLRITDIKAASKITFMEDGKVENFAAWLRLGDIWKTPGDFSIPKTEPKRYRALEKGIRDALARLDALDRTIKAREAQGENLKKVRRRWKAARATALHDPKSADELITEVLTMVK